MNDRLDKAVIAALKSCIDAHGPITKEWLESARKRVVSAVRGHGRMSDVAKTLLGDLEKTLDMGDEDRLQAFRDTSLIVTSIEEARDHYKKQRDRYKATLAEHGEYFKRLKNDD